ncbi:major capsid protein [Bacillus phage vB_BceM-HSE3]|nr:major capsid protein [Bacillus phage vB_BceM-HSE3]
MSDILNYYPAASQLLERYAAEIQDVNEAQGSAMSLDKQVTLATVLENTHRQVAKFEHMTESTQTSDVGAFKKAGFDIVTALMPSLIANDIVSVQPMSSRTGEIRYLKYLYGSNKGRTKAGTEFTNSFQRGETDFNYSADLVEGEFVAKSGETEYEVNLGYYPVRPGSVELMVGAQLIHDNGQGVLTGAGLAAGSTVDYATGAVHLKFAAAAGDDVLATYEYQNEFAPTSVPQVDLRLDLLPIIAKSRKLRALYSFDAAFDLTQDYGMDINTTMSTQITSEIKHEIDGELMNDLLVQAGATQQPLEWSKTVAAGISVADHYASFFNTTVEAGNAIFAATKRASASFIVIGIGVANIVETLPQFRSAGQVNPVGPHLCGTLNGMPVYKNPYYPSDAFLVGYKGQGLFDSGLVYAPYMPVLSTQLLMDADFLGRRGFATSYGKKMVNNKVYAKGIIKL